MSAPNYTLRGIDDKSTNLIPYTSRPRSQHTPLFLAMTKRGPVDPVYIDIDGFEIFYSLYSLGENSPWHCHQTELVEIAAAVGNSTVIIKRIIDEYSRTASCVIGMDPVENVVVDKSLDNYIRDVNTANFAPFMTIEAHDPGEWGNYVGIEIFKADEKKQQTLGKQLGAIVYEAIVMIEDEHSGTRRALPNLHGETSTFFCLKPDAVANGASYYFDDIMADSYMEELAFVTRQPYFSRFYLHVESIAQAVNNPVFWEEDILSRVMPKNGKGFKRGLTFFCMGGSDGLQSEQNSFVLNRLDRQRRYDEAVRQWLLSIDESNPIVDMAKYPFSTIWDSGFTKETKLAFANLQRYRKDVWLAMTAFSHYRYIETDNGEKVFDNSVPLSPDELISLASFYKSYFSNHLESVDFGTPVTRCTLTIQDGIKRNSKFKKRQSINIDLFERVAKYAGKGDGKWDGTYAFDQDGTNVLTGWSDVSLPYMSPSLKESAWNNGVIYVESKDHVNYFYPMYQTLYPNDTSVLNSLFVMMACCYIQYLHYQAWTQISGNSKETNEVLASKVDSFLNGILLDAFDGRFIVEAKTECTDIDKLLGYKFTTNTNLYATMTKHTANFKINAHRMLPVGNS